MVPIRQPWLVFQRHRYTYKICSLHLLMSDFQLETVTNKNNVCMYHLSCILCAYSKQKRDTGASSSSILYVSYSLRRCKNSQKVSHHYQHETNHTAGRRIVIIMKFLQANNTLYIFYELVMQIRNETRIFFCLTVLRCRV